MGTGSGDHTSRLADRVERCLARCAELSQTGRHRKVLKEVERMLAVVQGDSRMEAQLLVWKAQALLAMGCADRALPAASRSWDLEASAYACHLMSNALNALGHADDSEDLLRMGWGLFPEAVHLPVQLAMMLADQGRLPEALDALDEVSPTRPMPEEMQVFVLGLRSNLLATVGRWAEARDLLGEAVDRYPDSSLLQEASDSLDRAWRRSRAEQELVSSWRRGLEALTGVAMEVDESIVHCGAVTELAELLELAARRLWRAYLKAETVQPQSPDAWASALILAVRELDGEPVSAAAMARAVGTNPSTVRGALTRARAFLARLEPEFARRSYAASSNPRLTQESATARKPSRPGNIIPFPDILGGTEPT